MKKLFFIALMALMVTVGANAQVYTNKVVGEKNT